MHSREHLLVSADHRLNDRIAKIVEVLGAHFKGLPQFLDYLLPAVFRQQREIVAGLSNRKRSVHIFDRTVGLIEQWLREGHNRFCNGAHCISLRVIAPSWIAEATIPRSSMDGKPVPSNRT